VTVADGRRLGKDGGRDVYKVLLTTDIVVVVEGSLTEKSDVYGFGVVLLELLTGRLPMDSLMPLGSQSLVTWVSPQSWIVLRIEKHSCGKCLVLHILISCSFKGWKDFSTSRSLFGTFVESGLVLRVGLWLAGNAVAERQSKSTRNCRPLSSRHSQLEASLPGAGRCIQRWKLLVWACLSLLVLSDLLNWRFG